jgi:hypothetical protein
MNLTPFSPPPGINSDDTTFSAQGRWADGSNVRFRLGKPETVGGSNGIAAGASGATALLAHKVMAVGITPTVGYLLSAGTTTLIAFVFPSSGSLSSADVTPASGWSGTLGNSLSMWGTTVLVSNSQGKMFAQSGSSQATLVAAAPAKMIASVVTPQRQAIALGCNEEISTTFNTRCIRGSDLEDYTNWTTSATNNAFEYILESGGDIVTGGIVGDNLVVWCTAAMWLGQFIGDPSQTYRFEKVSDVGCVSLHGFAVHDQSVYFLSDDFRLRVWAAGAEPVEIPCPILNDFTAYCSDTNRSKIHLVYVSKYQEVWIFYPDTRDGGSACSRYIAYSIAESAAAQTPVWFRGVLARGASLDAPALTGVSTGVGQYQSALIAADAGSTQIYADDSKAGTSVAISGAYIQSAGFSLNNSQIRVMVRGIIPDFEYQTGDVSLTLYMRDRPQSTAVTKGPYTLTNSATKKDFRASGKIMAVKLSTASAVAFRLGKPLFDTVILGER